MYVGISVAFNTLAGEYFTSCWNTVPQICLASTRKHFWNTQPTYRNLSVLIHAQHSILINVRPTLIYSLFYTTKCHHQRAGQTNTPKNTKLSIYTIPIQCKHSITESFFHPTTVFKRSTLIWNLGKIERT